MTQPNLKKLLTKLKETYPATDSKAFLDLEIFDNIGQPAKSTMIALCAATILGYPEATIKALEKTVTQNLLRMTFNIASKQSLKSIFDYKSIDAHEYLTAHFKAAKILLKKKTWQDTFKAIQANLEKQEKMDKASPAIETEKIITLPSPSPFKA